MKFKTLMKNYDKECVVVLFQKGEWIGDSTYGDIEKYQDYEVKEFGVLHTHNRNSLYHYALFVELKGVKQ